MTGATYSKPLPLPATGYRRRLEVFSPKLARRVSLGSDDAWRCWVALEANPAITTFCERPARMAGHGGGSIDFSVQLDGALQPEFWLIWDEEVDTDADPSQVAEADVPAAPERFHDLSVRVVTPKLLASWDVPVANWAQILPILVSFRSHRKPLLEQSIVARLTRSASLDDLIERFDGEDPDQVTASLYQLLALGRVLSPELATAPLGGATRFRRA